mgnify:CR=1 FL=1
MKTVEQLAALSPLRKGLFALLLFLAFLKFVFFPLNQWQADSLDRIAVLKRSVAQKEHLLDQAAQLEERLEKASRVLSQSSRLFWQNVEDGRALMLKVQKRLEKLAPETGVNIESVQWGQPSGETVFQAPVDLTLAARPRNLLAFMAAIESADKFYTLDRLRLTCRSRYEKIEADMTVSAYGVP